MLKIDPKASNIFFPVKPSEPTPAAIGAPTSTHTPSSLKSRVGQLSGDGLIRALKEEFKGLDLTSGQLKWVSELASAASLHGLEGALQRVYEKELPSVEWAQAMEGDAKYWLEVMESKEVTPSLMSRLYEAILNFFDTMVKAFGISHFFEATQGVQHAKDHTFQLVNLIHIIQFFNQLISPTSISPTSGSGSTTAPSTRSRWVEKIFALIALTSLFYHRISPRPRVVPSARSWTRDLKEGNLPYSEVRKDVMDRMYRALTTVGRFKKHPILLGETGIGKTEAAKSFCAAVYRGDYPELKGKEVFYINCANLICPSMRHCNGDSILTRIQEAIGRHRDNVILVLDEIHQVCQVREKSALADQLKTLLDPSAHGIPYVIGITTEEEYYRDIVGANNAFARRFETIPVVNTTDSETREILSRMLIRSAPDIIVERGAIQALLPKEPEARERGGEGTDPLQTPEAEPARSIHLLSRCIQSIRHRPMSQAEKVKREKEQELRSMRSSTQAGLSGGYSPESIASRREKIAAINGEIAALNETIADQVSQFDELAKVRGELVKAKTEMFRVAAKVAKIQGERFTKSETQQISKFLLLLNFLIPTMEHKVYSLCKSIGVVPALSVELVKGVIGAAEEEKIQAKARAEHAGHRSCCSGDEYY